MKEAQKLFVYFSTMLQLSLQNHNVTHTSGKKNNRECVTGMCEARPAQMPTLPPTHHRCGCSPPLHLQAMCDCI